MDRHDVNCASLDPDTTACFNDRHARLKRRGSVPLPIMRTRFCCQWRGSITVKGAPYNLQWIFPHSESMDVSMMAASERLGRRVLLASYVWSRKRRTY
jgi:hypothetical protein